MIRKYLYSSLGLALLNSVMAHDQAHVNQAIETIEIAAKDVSDQNSGNYPRLNRQGSLAQIQKVWDKPGQGDGSYSVTYSQDEVICLNLREFMTTTVILPSWEKIIDIDVGDNYSFESNRLRKCVLF